MEKIIYTDTLGYPEIRNIANLPFTSYRVQKRLNLFRLPNAVNYHYLKRTNQFFLNSHFEGVKRKNIHHFFNTISFGNAPWLSTFETFLPRWGNVPPWLERRGVELLAAKKCKKLIAISDCTRNIQADYLNRFPDLKEHVLEKTITIHPPQKQLISSPEEKEEKVTGSLLNVLLVGNQICSKGGREAVNVIIKLVKQGAPIRLTIVSGMEPDSYASHTKHDDIKELKKIVFQNPGCVNWVGRQSNEYVVDALLNSDLAVLPTYADTYGYFVLEAQAAACPVISTNIRALPEINNQDCGWLIEVPKNQDGNALLASENERQILSQMIEEQLYNILYEVCSNPTGLSRKGALALGRIKKHHSPHAYAQKLESIYDEIGN